MRIKDNCISNFESKERINSKVGLIKDKALIKLQHKDAVNRQASEISPEIYGDLMATSLYWLTSSIPPVACCSSICVQLGNC